MIVVGVEESPGSDLALRWALDDARARNADVQLICCHRQPPVLGWDAMGAVELTELAGAGRDAAHAVLDRALRQAAELAPEVRVTGAVVEGGATDVLVERSAHAATLVVGSRQLKALGSVVLGSVGAGLAARSLCPVVVVRGPAGMPAEAPAVVVGVDGTDAADEALDFGFDHASAHGVRLRAVLCWRNDVLASMQWRPEAPVPDGAERWLSDKLSPWQQRYPDVSASGVVIRDHPVAGLVDQSSAEHLLVVRSRARGAVTGALLGSVAQGVLHHATCPVAVIPAAA